MSELQIVNKDIYNAEVMSRIKGIYNSSTPEVQQQFLTILEELARDGESRTLEQIYLADFKEIPVSIDRFLTDPYYLGGTNDNGNSIYPGWWGVYRDVFDPHKDIYEVVLSGAQGWLKAQLQYHVCAICSICLCATVILRNIFCSREFLEPLLLLLT